MHSKEHIRSRVKRADQWGSAAFQLRDLPTWVIHERLQT